MRCVSLKDRRSNDQCCLAVQEAERLRNEVLDNLGRLASAPSVNMSEVPPEAPALRYQLDDPEACSMRVRVVVG